MQAQYTCLNCGKGFSDDFRANRQRLYCSRECWQSRGKTRTPEDKVAYMKRYTIQKHEAGLCYACMQPAVAGGSYCEKHLLTLRSNAQRYRQRKRDQGVCYQCGKGKPETGKRYCETCAAKARELSALPTSYRNFRGGRLIALERDGYQCQVCGVAANVAHHIDGFGMGSSTPNHALDNLITLCRRCHGSLENLLKSKHIDVIIALLQRKMPTRLQAISKAAQV